MLSERMITSSLASATVTMASAPRTTRHDARRDADADRPGPPGDGDEVVAHRGLLDDAAHHSASTIGRPGSSGLTPTVTSTVIGPTAVVEPAPYVAVTV